MLCQERVFFEKKEGARDNVWGMLKGLGKNRPLLALVCAALMLLLASLLGQTMNNYLFLDYFKNAKVMSVVNVVSVAGTLLLAPFVSKIVTKFGKKEAGSVYTRIQKGINTADRGNFISDGRGAFPWLPVF